MSSSSIYIPEPVVRRMQRVQALVTQLGAEEEPSARLVPGSPALHKRVIVLPGAFNPPTSAHVALLKEAHHYARQQGNMQLYAAFTLHTIDKEDLMRPLLLDRILLLQQVLQRLPRTGILLINRGLYVEQAEGIRRAFPAVRQIFFLMGYDKIVQIFDPHYYEDRDASLKRLFALAQLLVVPRGQAGDADLHALLERPENRPFASSVHLLPFGHEYSAVSSTRIRQDASAPRTDIPREARAFMRRTRAYAPPIRLQNGSSFDVYGQRMREIKACVGDET